jgi:general secretion pathway protein H
MTDAWPMRRDGQSGLTLIEMLIVLVIIGIATSAAVLSVNMVGRDRRAEDEAVRLVAHLEMAVDEGLVSRTPLALFWTAGGYGFKRQTADGWQAAETPRLVADHALPSALVLHRMDGVTDPVLVAEDGLGAAVNLELSGTGVPWVVAFNGFSATARPGFAP